MSNQLIVHHTSGPWGVKRNLGEKTFSIYRQSELDKYAEVRDFLCLSVKIANVYTGGLAYGESAEANARLIAAAPDLLRALKGVLRVADRKTDEFDAARAAIAKAGCII